MPGWLRSAEAWQAVAGLFLLCLFVHPLLSQKTAEPKIIARTQEFIQNLVRAEGNVEVEYKSLKLFADRIELNMDTKDIFAEGHVVIQTPDEVISAERIFFNLDSTLGKMENAFGMVQPDIRYQAESIEKKAENIYIFGKSQFTSCTQPVPRWKFSCARANLKRGDFIEMWGALVSIKKIPIFYLPYMRYPLDKEGATGFLMPLVGYSRVKGFSYSQTFYWAMARNMNATFTLDYFSTRGAGGGLEHRYLFSGGTGGSLNLYFFAFKKDSEWTGPDNAYFVRWNHNQPLPLGFSLSAEIDHQSSFEFLREFDNDFMRATVSNRRSQVHVSKAWSSFNFNMRASRFETHFPGAPGESNSIITQYLPQISFNSFKMKLISPLYFSFSSSFSRWQHGWQSEYKAGTETRSQSLTFHPVLSMPLTYIPWLTANLSAEANFAYYWQTYALVTAAGGQKRAIVDEPLLRQNFTLNVELVGPVFYRVWEIGQAKKEGKEREGSWRLLKHIIEPYIAYRYDSPVASPERIITPYGFFRFHQLSYGLTNHILLKEEIMPKEVFTWGLSQTFYFSPENSPLSAYRVEGKIPEFSEVNTYVRFYPAARYSLDISANFNPYYQTFSSIRLGTSFRMPSDALFVNVSWFKSVDSWEIGSGSMSANVPASVWSRHQISLFGGIKVPALSIEAQGEMDFNILERKMLYSGLSFVYHYQCLDLKADIRIFYFREKPEAQYRISIGLGNIGRTTDILGGWESR